MMTTEMMTRGRSPEMRPPASAIGALWIGLVLTVAVTIVPFTTDALRDHVRASYPRSTAAHVDDAVTAWLVVVGIVGALGIVGWLWTIWIARSGSRWTPWIATTLFVLGTGTAVAGLLVEDSSGDVGLAPMLGWLGMVPCLVGLVAVVLLWRRPT